MQNSLDLGNEISIARNNQNAVKAISIAGARHQLDDLQKAIKAANPKWDLRTDESNMSDDLIDTEKLLQVATALMPAYLCEPASTAGDAPKKVYSYSMRAKCLREFVDSWEAKHTLIDADATEKEKERQKRLVERYDYYVGMAPAALMLY